LAALLPADLNQLAGCIGWAAALHDIGKFSPGFQWKVPEVAEALGRSEVGAARNETYRHDSLGYALWAQHLETR
jgi:CRISPR-associated endonuclease Cas3-HD